VDLPSYVLGESCDKRYLMLGGIGGCGWVEVVRETVWEEDESMCMVGSFP